MFSIPIAPPQERPPERPSRGRQLLGKLLGFTAGLTLIAGIDALFLHSAVWQGLSGRFAAEAPTIEHALRVGWAALAAR